MATNANEYILYYNRYSICSLMALYTLRLRGPPRDARSEMVVSLKEVDIFREEQLTEHFLCEINAEGQV